MDRVRRPRVVIAKPSKRGCRTCRIRKIKCDETRPNCQRCTSTGRTCDGYNNLLLPNPIEATKRSLLPSSSICSKADLTSDRHAPALLLPRPNAPLCPLLCMNDYEINSFDYFRLRSAYPIWQISPTREWVQLALQLSTDDTIVFKAAAAVGAINEAMAQISHHSLVRPKHLEKEARAIELYCKASAQLRQSINLALVGKASLGPIILCCILFVCVEVLLERSEVAAAHLQFGRMVVRDFFHARKRHCHVPPVNDPLFTSVMREALQTFSQTVGAEDEGVAGLPNLLDLRITKAHGRITSVETLLDMPFTSVCTAKSALKSLIRHGCNVRRQFVQIAEAYIASNCEIPLDEVSRYCLAQTLSRSIDLSQDTQLQRDLTSLINLHELWLERLHEFQQHNELGSSTYRTLSLLEIQHFESHFSLLTARQIHETETDSFSPRFDRTLQLAEEYLVFLSSHLSVATHPTDRKEVETHPSFSLDTGLLPALHLIAIKSRSSAIRQKALDLLISHNRREGLLWSQTMGHHASKIVQEEGRRAGALKVSVVQKRCHDEEGSEDVEIPEVARFVDVVHAGADRVEDACVVASRYMHEFTQEESGIEILKFRHVKGSLALEEIGKWVFPWKF